MVRIGLHIEIQTGLCSLLFALCDMLKLSFSKMAVTNVWLVDTSVCLL